MTVWRMRITCRISKTTNTNSEYVILLGFSGQQYLHQLAFTLRCLVLLNIKPSVT
jgi:hypothetical protein